MGYASNVVFATELVCGKCHNDKGVVIFEKEPFLRTNSHESNNELF